MNPYRQFPTVTTKPSAPAGSINVQPIEVTQRVHALLKLAQHPMLSLDGYRRAMWTIRTLRTAARYQYGQRQAG